MTVAGCWVLGAAPAPSTQLQLPGPGGSAILSRIMPHIRLTHLRNALLCCAIAVTAFGQAAPTFKVDPTWPQEMPNHWIMGAVTGVFVDAKQHVWVTHLPETLTEEELYEEPWNVVTPPARGSAPARGPERKAGEDRHLLQGRAARARIRPATAS